MSHLAHILITRRLADTHDDDIIVGRVYVSRRCRRRGNGEAGVRGGPYGRATTNGARVGSRSGLHRAARGSKLSCIMGLSMFALLELIYPAAASPCCGQPPSAPSPRASSSRLLAWLGARSDWTDAKDNNSVSWAGCQWRMKGDPTKTVTDDTAALTAIIMAN